jgi:hypothetical protein
MAMSTKGQCPVCPAIVHWPIVSPNWRFRCWNCNVELQAVVIDEVDQDGVVTENHKVVEIS